MLSPGFTQRCAYVPVVRLVGFENLVRVSVDGIIQREEQVATRHGFGGKCGHGLARGALCLRNIPGIDVGLAQIDARFPVGRVQGNRGQVAGFGFLIAPLRGQRISQRGVRLGAAGRKLYGTAACANGFRGPPQLRQDGGKHHIALGVGRRQIEHGKSRQDGFRRTHHTEKRNGQRFPGVPEFGRCFRQAACHRLGLGKGLLGHQLMQANGLAGDGGTRVGLMTAGHQNARIEA
ncbi:hypothetical protein D3C71_1393420 [compost metagenome]